MLVLQILTLILLLSGSHGQDIGLHIVGGINAYEGEFPFMARLTQLTKHQCGCTIVSAIWVLTAAQCLLQQDRKHFRVEYGSIDMDSPQRKATDVVKAFIHPEFRLRDYSYVNDIALLGVKPEIDLETPNVRAVQLPKMGEETPQNVGGIAIGWGRDSSQGALENRLQKIDLPILSDEKCRDIYKESFHPSSICAGTDNPDDARDVCYGDAGGPLLVNYVQIGITSWGEKPCAVGPNYASVFTKVSSYIEWINETMEDN